ncbi:MAG: response regulator [Actinoplanes sp.]
MAAIHALVVEDSDDDALLIVLQLRRGGINLTHERVQTAPALQEALTSRPPQLLICDYNLPSFSAEEALTVLVGSGLDIPFIVVSGKVDEEVAATLMRAGAHDFVLKHRMDRLVPAVQRELREAEARHQRRLVEIALRDSEDRFRLIAEHLQDVVFRYRLLPVASLDYISPAVTALTGYSPGELAADPSLIFAMVEPEDRAAFRLSWHLPNLDPLIVKWRHRDGRLVWFEQRAVGVRDEQGRSVAVEGVLRDITAQTLANQERERLDRDLRQTERLDSLGQLAGGVAHDFNNLLTVITGYSEQVIATLAPDHPCHGDVIQIARAADKAAALTRQLLIFSRLEPSQPRILDLNGVVIEIERLLRRTIGENIEFLTTLQPGLRPVTIDPSKVEQVIINLVMNARAAMPVGGRIHIATDEVPPPHPATGPPTGPDRWVSLSVTDNGHGMSAEVAKHVFEPFFTTKGPGQGTGLGLATAYGVITEAGGFITLSSVEHHGTTFTVLLPAAEYVAVQAELPSPETPAGAGQTILVVEDDDAVRDVVQRILAKGGYHALLAATPKEALEISGTWAIHLDAMLTDVVMPEMSGPQLAVRVQQQRPGIPVLLMSGYTAGSLPGGHDITGGSPLIRKPFTRESLLHRIHLLLAERRS